MPPSPNNNRYCCKNKHIKCNKKSIEISAECIEPLLQITKHGWNMNKYKIINKLHKCDNGNTFYSSNFGPK